MPDSAASGGRHAPGRIRTCGQRIRSPSLCPLSYGRSRTGYRRGTYVLTPKSVVMMTTSRPPNTPGAAGTETAESPISRQRALEDVLAVAGAAHPELHGTGGVDARGRPEQVLADGPAVVAVRAVVALHALPERRAVAGGVGEESECAHRTRVRVGGRRERARGAKGHEPVLPADRVQLDQHLALELVRRRERARRISRRGRPDGADAQERQDGKGCNEARTESHRLTIGRSRYLVQTPKGGFFPNASGLLTSRRATAIDSDDLWRRLPAACRPARAGARASRRGSPGWCPRRGSRQARR